VEDAIGKLQSFLDDAALAVQPIEEDPVKKKKLLKQCATGSDMAMSSAARVCMPQMPAWNDPRLASSAGRRRLTKSAWRRKR
jgi:hypothetical protein